MLIAVAVALPMGRCSRFQRLPHLFPALQAVSAPGSSASSLTPATGTFTYLLARCQAAARACLYRFGFRAATTAISPLIRENNWASSCLACLDTQLPTPIPRDGQLADGTAGHRQRHRFGRQRRGRNT